MGPGSDISERTRYPYDGLTLLGLAFMLKSMVAARCYFFGHNKFSQPYIDERSFRQQITLI
eukprot:scaffold4015_cov200-Skeletonema_marinoi.AAC.10